MWLIPIVLGLAAVCAMFLAKPQNRRAAAAAVILTLTASVYQAYDARSTAQSKAAIERRIYNSLSGATYSYLNNLSELIVRSSDGWLPDNEEAFFSSKVADSICHELNVDTPAPVTPPVTLAEWFLHSCSKYRDTLRMLIAEGGSGIDSDFIASLSAVETSFLLDPGWSASRAPLKQLELQSGVRRPPLLCWGAEPLIAESLQHMKKLVQELSKGEQRYGIARPREWLKFPQHYQKKFLGTARFGAQDLQAWQAAHPGVPGPMLFGSGNPNKAPVIGETGSRYR